MADRTTRQQHDPSTSAGESATRRTYRLGVLGAGRVFDHLHLPALRAHPRWTVAAVHDPDVVRLERVRTRLRGATLVPDADLLLARPELDAVLILAPPDLHPDLTLRALDHGRAVLVEKPLATRVEAAEKVVACWRDAARPVLVGFNRRHRPVYRALRERIAGGSLRCVRFTLVADARRWTRKAGHDELLDDLASHGLDLVTWLAGRRLVRLRARPRARGRVRVDGTLDGGVRVRIDVGRGARYVEWLAVDATAGRWVAHPGGLLPTALAPPAVRGWIASAGVVADVCSARLRGRPTQSRRSALRQLDDLADRLAGRAGLGGADAEAGLWAVRAVHACRISLRDGGTTVDLRRAANRPGRRPSPAISSPNDTTEA